MNSASVSKPSAPTPQHGPLDWRRLVQWLHSDAVISAAEGQHLSARCAQDDKPMDIEQLTQWLAARVGPDYLRIDPLKVDVGKVADTMSAAYAERHKILPVQITPSEVVVATAEPFITDWVAEVERQARRTVRCVLANPQETHRFTA